MTAFDPEKFEDKYVHYFDELQEAYRSAYQSMHGRYDSDILRAIDRQVLDESEPFYEGNGEFRVALPDNPRDRVQNLSADNEKFDATLQEFIDQIEFELARTFGFDADNRTDDVSSGTDNAQSCPVCDATDTERVERGAGDLYRCQNCSAAFDAAGNRVESG